MSSPHSSNIASVNECIPLTPFSLHYTTVDNAIQLIKLAGQGAWLAKADITDAFKTMPIHPSDWPYFGVKWNSKFHFAVRLTFGCRSSPHIFNSLSEALCWILLNVCKLPFVLHLLDDFLLIDFPSSQSSILNILKQIFSDVGVPLCRKNIGPLYFVRILRHFSWHGQNASFPSTRETSKDQVVSGIFFLSTQRLVTRYALSAQSPQFCNEYYTTRQSLYFSAVNSSSFRPKIASDPDRWWMIVRH